MYFHSVSIELVMQKIRKWGQAMKRKFREITILLLLAMKAKWNYQFSWSNNLLGLYSAYKKGIIKIEMHILCWITHYNHFYWSVKEKKDSATVLNWVDYKNRVGVLIREIFHQRKLHLSWGQQKQNFPVFHFFFW